MEWGAFDSSVGHVHRPLSERHPASEPRGRARWQATTENLGRNDLKNMPLKRRLFARFVDTLGLGYGRDCPIYVSSVHPLPFNNIFGIHSCGPTRAMSCGSD